MVDGMRVESDWCGPSLTTAPSSSSMYQIYFSTNIDSAEVGQSGIRINLIPKDGGNQLRGSIFSTYTRDSWQSSNVDDYLRSQGLTEPAKTLKLWDFNPSVGGPIARDRLWFQTTYQNNGSDAQSWQLLRCRSVAVRLSSDPSRPAVNIGRAYSRAAADVAGSQKDKVRHYERQDSKTPHFGSPLPGSTAARVDAALAVPNNDQVGARWTRRTRRACCSKPRIWWSQRDTNNNYRDASWVGAFLKTQSRAGPYDVAPPRSRFSRSRRSS
jgi:hypothetical protein